MSEPKTTRASDQFPLRLPDGMRDELKRLANENGRSMNAEIVSALEDYLVRKRQMDFATDIIRTTLSSGTPEEIVGRLEELRETEEAIRAARMTWLNPPAPPPRQGRLRLKPRAKPDAPESSE